MFTIIFNVYACKIKLEHNAHDKKVNYIFFVKEY